MRHQRKEKKLFTLSCRRYKTAADSCSKLWLRHHFIKWLQKGVGLVSASANTPVNFIHSQLIVTAYKRHLPHAVIPINTI